jgi:hypothetical protein
MIASSYSYVIVSLLASLPSSIVFLSMPLSAISRAAALALPIAQLHAIDQRPSPAGRSALALPRLGYDYFHKDWDVVDASV